MSAINSDQLSVNSGQSVIWKIEAGRMCTTTDNRPTIHRLASLLKGQGTQ
jgi:hypothetical protein